MIPTLFGIGIVLMCIQEPAFDVAVSGATVMRPSWIGMYMVLAAIAISAVRGGRIHLPMPYQISYAVAGLAAAMMLSIIANLHASADIYVLAYPPLLLACWYAGTQYDPYKTSAAIWGATAVACASTIAIAIIVRDDNGGVFSLTNYDLAAGAIGIVLAILIAVERQWKAEWTLAALGLAATLSAEGVLILGAVAVWLMWHRRRYAVIVTVIGAVISIALADRIYYVMANPMDWGAGRWPAYEHALSTISPLGIGYSATDYHLASGHIIAHNVPIVVMQQCGIIGFVFWAAAMVSIWRWRPSMRVPLVLLGVVGIADHMIWTALAPLYWTALGILSRQEVTDGIPQRQLAADHIDRGGAAMGSRA